jgi:NAD(P)-dependent dehydrogenase (short-subunit alcohol dehydrogenase family)
VAKEIGGIYLHLDVREEDEWEAAMETILKRYGKLNILVNNAGVTGFQEGFGPQDPEGASLASWREVHAVNSDGVFLGCKYAIQTMKKGEGGAIVNISSRSGLVGIPGAAAYASSKAAVRNHTKTVALYCCQQGYKIRCNSIHPAAILTPMWACTR